jgi:hypothetical protein
MERAPADPGPSPAADFLRSAVVYQIFPRLHSDSADFEGVRRDLPRIADLGANVLYVMPVHPMGDGNRHHLGSPYGIADHRAINPAYGTEADLRRLVEDAQGRGMKVILDTVLHHLSGKSPVVAEHPEWFLKDAEGKPTCKVAAWAGCADFLYEYQEVWEYQIETLRQMLAWGIDGFRFDVAPLVPMAFWREARRQLDPQRTQPWIAESGFMRFVKKDRDLGVPHHSDPELHDVFDATYDADGKEYLLAYFAGQAELDDILRQVYLQETLYPPHAVKLRLLEDHDDPRISHRIKDPEQLRNWTAFMALLPGASLVYAGHEVAVGRSRTFGSRGQEHYHNERNAIDWATGDRKFETFCGKLFKLAYEVKEACRVCHVTQVANGLVRIDWRGESRALTALLNLETKSGELAVPWKLKGRDALTCDAVEISGSYAIRPTPLLVDLDPQQAPTPVAAGESFSLHGGADWGAAGG